MSSRWRFVSLLLVAAVMAGTWVSVDAEEATPVAPEGNDPEFATLAQVVVDKLSPRAWVGLVRFTF